MVAPRSSALAMAMALARWAWAARACSIWRSTRASSAASSPSRSIKSRSPGRTRSPVATAMESIDPAQGARTRVARAGKTVPLVDTVCWRGTTSSQVAVEPTRVEQKNTSQASRRPDSSREDRRGR
jgi:hypothetical protein